MSVIRGHHERSSDFSWRSCSVITSIASSVILEQPVSDKWFKFVMEWASERIPWSLISQQWSRVNDLICDPSSAEPKNSRQQSLEWYAYLLKRRRKKKKNSSVETLKVLPLTFLKSFTWRVNSFRWSNICETAATVSSAIFMQSLIVRHCNEGTSRVQSPESVISLQPK